MAYPYNSAGEWQYGEPERMTRYREPMERTMTTATDATPLPKIPDAAVDSVLRVLRGSFGNAEFSLQCDGLIWVSNASDIDLSALRFFIMGVNKGFLCGEMSAMQRSA